MKRAALTHVSDSTVYAGHVHSEVIMMKAVSQMISELQRLIKMKYKGKHAHMICQNLYKMMPSKGSSLFI